jgi:hypothetical protein
MKFNTRELVTLAVFGVLWGIVEISLGTVLKSLNVPLSGVVLGAIGLSIALVGRIFVPRKGSTLFIGVIAMILKLFSLGGVIIGPMIGIMSEAIIAELILSTSGKPSRFKLILAGSLGVLWSMIQPFITSPLLFGRSVLMVWLNLLDQGRRLFGISGETAWAIVLVMAVVHLVIGGLAGWFAWEAGKQLQLRMGKSPVKAAQA